MDYPEEKPVLRSYDRCVLRVLPPLVALVIRVYLGLCRVVTVQGETVQADAVARSEGRAVFATWHQRMLFLARYFSRRRLTVMISQSRDGEYGARIAGRLGFDNVRGSSTRGGIRALRKLSALLARGARAGILADGPQGPARVAKIGAVLLARDAAAPLIPVVWAADRCWVVNSWDRYMIPKPFARVAVCYGQPIWVPPKTRGDKLEAYRLLLEERLNAAARHADRLFGKERPCRREKDAGASA